MATRHGDSISVDDIIGASQRMFDEAKVISGISGAREFAAECAALLWHLAKHVKAIEDATKAKPKAGD